MPSEEADMAAAAPASPCGYTLTVRVHQARALPAADDFTSDPYVELRVGAAGQPRRTRRIGRDIDPVWEEALELPVDKRAASDGLPLRVHVYDANFLRKNILLCRAALPLPTCYEGGPWWAELEPSDRLRTPTPSYIQLSFSWTPAAPPRDAGIEQAEREACEERAAARAAQKATRAGALGAETAALTRWAELALSDEANLRSLTPNSPRPSVSCGANGWPAPPAAQAQAVHPPPQLGWPPPMACWPQHAHAALGTSMPWGAVPQQWPPPAPQPPPPAATPSQQPRVSGVLGRPALGRAAASPAAACSNKASPAADAGDGPRLGEGYFRATPSLSPTKQRLSRAGPQPRPSVGALALGDDSPGHAKLDKLDQLDASAERLHAFISADLDGSTTLDLGEFGAFLRKTEPTIADAEVRARFEAMDTDGNGRIDLREFLEWQRRQAPADHPSPRRTLRAAVEQAPAHASLARVFKRHDTSENAKLDFDQFARLVADLEPSVEHSAEELRRRFDRLDADADGEIDLDEFNRYHQVKMEEDSGTLADSLLGLG